MVSTQIHIYCNSLYNVYGLESVTHIVYISVPNYHPAYVIIIDRGVSYANGCHQYWDINVHISFHFTRTR